jgi:hypothetical protein
MKHEISSRNSPVSVITMCSCGWSHTETRRQNAWARAAKIKSAVRGHFARIKDD